MNDAVQPPEPGSEDPDVSAARGADSAGADTSAEAPVTDDLLPEDRWEEFEPPDGPSPAVDEELTGGDAAEREDSIEQRVLREQDEPSVDDVDEPAAEDRGV